MEKSQEEPSIVTHPWPPFIPRRTSVLIMGTFPPGRHRWSMDFYYPNPTNDFWFMMGLLFYNDRQALYDKERRTFRLPFIKALLDEKGIALNDTARQVRRLKGNASDKYLDILEPVDLSSLLSQMPGCRIVATTGEKAASVLAAQTDTTVPRMGEFAVTSDGLQLWRMPSTSRAYPMKLEDKAAYYRRLFEAAGII